MRQIHLFSGRLLCFCAFLPKKWANWGSKKARIMRFYTMNWATLRAHNKGYHSKTLARHKKINRFELVYIVFKKKCVIMCTHYYKREGVGEREYIKGNPIKRNGNSISLYLYLIINTLGFKG